MKKFLSLVLALVMTMSLVTVSAGAKDFTDDSKLNYEEAVDVMSALGVVGGYTDGSFNPSGTLTRGAAAKIICNLILGTTTADALTADAAPYKDVPVNHTFAPYIAYCAKEGIISGYADGTFRPANTLTGYAFMKMLLGALGLQADKEGYTGANWSISVAKRALSDNVDLADGLKGDFNGVKAVTREEACLYALNTLKACTFSYPNDSTIVVGNVSVSTSSKAVQAGAGHEYYRNVFTKLHLTNPGTAFGAPSDKWVLNGKEIGNYPKTADKVYNEKVKAKDIYADLNLSDAPTAANTHYFVDGVSTTPIAINKTNSTKYGAQGAETSVYYTASTNTVYVCVKNMYLGKVASIDAATKTEDRKINITGVGAASAAIVALGADSFETENFARKDYVVFTAASTDNGATYAVKSAVAAEKVTGEFTAYKGSDNVTVGGTVYKIGAKAAHTGATYESSVGALKDIVDLYLDANKNVLEIDTAEAADANYAYVLAAGNDSHVVNDYKAQLLFLDGSKKVVETDKDYTSGTTLVGHFVTYRTNSDGEYVLSDASASTSGNGNVKITNDASAMTVKGNPIYGNDSTIYVVATGTVGSETYTVYTGYKSVPSIDDGHGNAVSMNASYVCKTGNVANYVYINTIGTSAVINGGTNDVIFVYKNGTAGVNKNSDSQYYTLKAVINGEIGEINIDKNDAATSIVTGGTGAVSAIFSGRTVDKYNVSKMGSTTGTSAVGIDEISKGIMSYGWNGTDFTNTVAVDKDCNVFYVNKDEKIVAWDIDSVAYDTNDLVYFTTDKGAVNNLFIVAQ